VPQHVAALQCLRCERAVHHKTSNSDRVGVAGAQPTAGARSRACNAHLHVRGPRELGRPSISTDPPPTFGLPWRSRCLRSAGTE